MALGKDAQPLTSCHPVWRDQTSNQLPVTGIGQTWTEAKGKEEGLKQAIEISLLNTGQGAGEQRGELEGTQNGQHTSLSITQIG